MPEYCIQNGQGTNVWQVMNFITKYSEATEL